MLRRLALYLLAVFFIGAGANHFRSPQTYLEIMPAYLPWPAALNYLSGAAEILGGCGVLLPATRRAAGWGLIALLVAVWPANLQMALHGFRGLPAWVLWLRLPFQAVFIAWVYWTCLARPTPRGEPAGSGR